MAYTPDFQKQVQDYIDSQKTTLQGQLAAAQKNANVGSWGGSNADKAYWTQNANGLLNQLTALDKGSQDIFTKLQQGDIGVEGMDAVKGYLSGDPTGMEKLNEMVAGNQQLQSQNKQLSDFKGQLEQQYFGGKGLSLSDALSNPQGDLGNLNKFETQQTADTFNTQLKPLIQMALGAQGLSDSGAQVELQSKALAQLQQQQQQSMMQAALGARSQIEGLGYQNIQQGIGTAQQNMNNQFDLNRAQITMQYQQQLQQQQEQLAYQLSQRSGSAGGGGIGSLIGAGVGALGFLGGPAAGMMGMSLGSSLGGMVGNMVQPGSIGAGSPGLSGALAGGANFFANSTSTPSQNFATYNGGGMGAGMQPGQFASQRVNLNNPLDMNMGLYTRPI